MKRVRVQKDIDSVMLENIGSDKSNEIAKNEIIRYTAKHLVEHNVIDIIQEDDIYYGDTRRRYTADFFVMTDKEFKGLMQNLSELDRRLSKDYHSRSLLMRILGDLTK